MMDQIEDLMTVMRTITDSLAHDLRTPLTRMHNALEEAADPGASPAARNRAIQAAEAASLQALKLSSDLIEIARAESGVGRDLMTAIDLPALALELAEFFGPAAEDAGQRLVVGDLPSVTVIGHEPLIRQAVGNLLLNAIKYAGRTAEVTLEVFARDGRAGFVVGDNGPGVPEEDHGRVLSRFVRLETARPLPGSGLGLAIVAACAKLHRGEFSLQDNRPGLRAVVSLPVASGLSREPTSLEPLEVRRLIPRFRAAPRRPREWPAF
jgi:signal transduction histidine kinase